MMTGKNIVITGASSGIGLAVAQSVLEHGGNILAIALKQEELEQQFQRHQGRATLIPIDLSRLDLIESTIRPHIDAMTKIDALINCAGHDIGGRVGFDQANILDVQSVITVNLVALMTMTRLILPKMIAQNEGHIVNIGSTSSRDPSPNIAAYSTSKHGVHGFTQALRSEMAATDVRVTEIIPGPVRTNFAATRWGDDTEKGNAYYDNRPGCLTPEQVAQAIIWSIGQPSGVLVSEMVIVPNRQK